MSPQISCTAVEASAPQVVFSLPPFEEFTEPVYNQVHQEHFVTGEITLNIVEHPAVQEQVTVQEIPQVSVVERIQELCSFTGLMNPQISTTSLEASQVVGSLPPVEEFTEPVYNHVHQEQIVAGEMTQNIIENSAVEEQVIVQKIPVKQCHAVPITVTIWPIPFAELRWTTFTDSGFDTGERQWHQQGWLVCATNKYFNQERSAPAPVSVLHWRSRKLTRKTGSPQLVETYAASSAVVEMTWIKALWESMTWKDFDILTQRRSSRPLKTMMPHVIRNENPAYYDPESTLVMDSKGLFDALENGSPQDDRKSALEVPIIEEHMRRAMCRPRWCPHNRNAADAMTKFKGAHSEPLLTLLRTGMYTLKGEKSELADRATLRQAGTVPRHKVSAVRSVTERVFFSYATGWRGSLSGVREGGAM